MIKKIYLGHGTELHKEMQKHGFDLSLSGTYLHFSPRNAGSRWGRRHYDDINVKLARAQHCGRVQHAAHDHCMVLRHDQFVLASILGISFVYDVKNIILNIYIYICI